MSPSRRLSKRLSFPLSLASKKGGIYIAGSIALTAAGCPWAAFALNTAMTGVSVADDSMSWQQGLVQVGTSLATTGISIGAAELGTMASSGLNLAEGGAAAAVVSAGISTSITSSSSHLMSGVQWNPEGGWDYDKKNTFNKGAWGKVAAGAIASTAAAGTISGLGVKSDLLKSTIKGTYSTVGNGITRDDDQSWGSVVGQGAISTYGNYLGRKAAGEMTGWFGNNNITGNAYSQQLINNFTSYAGRKLLGSDEDFSWNSLTHVDTFNLAVQDTMRYGFNASNE